MSYLKLVLLVCILLVFINAESIPRTNTKVADDSFPSLQWIQSAEYNLLCSQIYNTAKENFNTLDLNNTHSALPKQENTVKLPLAVIVDIDETILLNLAFRKDTTTKVGTFSYDIWEKHIKAKSAIPIHGSLDYLQYLKNHNVKTIYISNRDYSEKNATYELLLKLGYPIDNQQDMLFKNERENWTKNKTSRRLFVTKRYKIIQIFGDNLLDFTETKQEAINQKNHFGKSWFLLPNPIYGNWNIPSY